MCWSVVSTDRPPAGALVAARTLAGKAGARQDAQVALSAGASPLSCRGAANFVRVVPGMDRQRRLGLEFGVGRHDGISMAVRPRRGSDGGAVRETCQSAPRLRRGRPSGPAGEPGCAVGARLRGGRGGRARLGGRPAGGLGPRVARLARRAAAAGSRPSAFETRLRRKDGSEFVATCGADRAARRRSEPVHRRAGRHDRRRRHPASTAGWTRRCCARSSTRRRTPSSPSRRTAGSAASARPRRRCSAIGPKR